MSLKWFTDAQDLIKQGEAKAGFNVTDIYKGPFPLVKDGAADRQDVELVHALIRKISISADEHFASIVLARTDAAGTKEYSVYCGDQQVAGAYRTDGATLAAQLRRDGVVSNDICNMLEAAPWVAQVADQANCAFFKQQARSGRICSHTQHLLSTVDQATLEAMATDLVDWKSGAKLPVSAATLGPMSEEEAAFMEAGFIQHVMLAGERGAGKTYLARQAADKFDAVYLELQCHAAMEPWEFRAHDRAWNGKVFTVLGKLAEAVYWIQQGKRVVLCLDEFLNMNPMYATAFNSPLSLTKDDKYLIETGVIKDTGDGIGIPEVVAVDSDKLWVVATTNVGARYGLDKIAPSVLARFMVIVMNTNADRTKTIAKNVLSEHGMPVQLADNFEKFLMAANQAVDQNELNEEVTTRLVTSIVRATKKKAERAGKVPTTVKQWMAAVKKQTLLEIGQVVTFEAGPYDPDQRMRYETLVEASFK